MSMDFNYLCQGLGHLTGLETRVYQNGVLLDRYANIKFNPDLSGLISNEIWLRQENVFYVETEDLFLYGIIQSPADQTILILGPTLQIRPNRATLISLLSRLNEPIHQLSALQDYFANIVPYPFENFLEILCFVNYAINGEKLAVSDLIAHGVLTQNPASTADTQTATDLTTAADQQSGPHNTLQAEQQMLSYVTAGNVPAIRTFFVNPPTGRSGEIAHSELRQRKNIFICSATLISRAAIAGGMSSELAFLLSDSYIKKAELLKTGSELTNLSMTMLLDYTRRVETLNSGNENARVARDVRRYILKNIGQKITTAVIAKELDLNRSYLCERFRQETGKTLNEYTSELKMAEARRLLEQTTLSVAQISDYLAFSSQSYLQTLFRKLEGCTPREYRVKARR